MHALLLATSTETPSVVEIPPDVKAVFWIGLIAALLAGATGLYFSKAFPLIYGREIPPEYPILFYAFAAVLFLMSNPAWATSLRMSLRFFVIGFLLAIVLTVVAAIWLHRMFLEHDSDLLP